MGEYIKVGARDGGSFRAYVAVPDAGTGPALVIGQEIFGINQAMRDVADFFAQEGYVAVVPDLFWRQQPDIELGYTKADYARAMELYKGTDVDKAVDDIAATLDVVRKRPDVTGTRTGFVGYCLGGLFAYLVAARTDVAVSVGYYGVGIENHLDEAKNIKCHLLLHFAELDQNCSPEARARILATLGGTVPDIQTCVYPGVGHAFARPSGDHYNRRLALLAHQRTIGLLKRVIGPEYDLVKLWENHLRLEFENRDDISGLMNTMVDDNHVNHIPVMTGGVGRKELSRFYINHFLHANPDDMELTPVSRTIGANQLVDEFIISFTHDREIDWMLPGIKPTGRKVRIPFVGIIRFRGPLLEHEHVYWDQASVLVQLGLLDPRHLPICGAEQADKVLDKGKPTNSLMAKWTTSEGKYPALIPRDVKALLAGIKP